LNSRSKVKVSAERNSLRCEHNVSFVFMEKNLSWSAFEKVKMAVGTVLSASDFPEARNPAWKLEIDFGAAIGTLKSSAQITDLYGKSDLVGKQVVAVVNFPPKQIGPFMSECLVLGAVGDDRGVILLQPERKVENGLMIS
jgi:tRNA-binding protein